MDLRLGGAGRGCNPSAAGSRTQGRAAWTEAHSCQNAGCRGMMPRVKHPPSPCDSTCRIDPQTGWCRGCQRTLKEIADWPMLTALEKREVLRSLEGRPRRDAEGKTG